MTTPPPLPLYTLKQKAAAFDCLQAIYRGDLLQQVMRVAAEAVERGERRMPADCKD
jgi:hypothetical protein